MPWRVRLLRESDLDAVIAIERESFPSPWRRAYFQQELDNPLSLCLAAIPVDHSRSSCLMGYLCAWTVRDEMQILNVATHPAWRRRGVARVLLQRALQLAAERGVRRVALEVRQFNDPAIKLYRAMGFRNVGKRSGYYQDTGEDAFVMVKRLRTMPHESST